MEWKYVKPLVSMDSIEKFEELVSYHFPEEFKKCIIECNGGRPIERTFDTDKVSGRELKSFLSFNMEDKETVWKLYEWLDKKVSDKYVVFATDNFGNMICFSKIDNSINFINHEEVDMDVEKIAKDFNEFMHILYD